MAISTNLELTYVCSLDCAKKVIQKKSLDRAFNEKIDDALFYRQIDYVIYINKDFNKEFMSGNDPEIEIKTTGNFESSYSEM